MKSINIITLLSNHLMKTYKRNPQNSKKSQNRTPNNKLQKDNKSKQQLIGDHNFVFIVLAIILNKYILGKKRKNKTSRGQLEIPFLWFILQGQKNKNTWLCNFLLSFHYFSCLLWLSCLFLPCYFQFSIHGFPCYCLCDPCLDSVPHPLRNRVHIWFQRKLSCGQLDQPVYPGFSQEWAVPSHPRWLKNYSNSKIKCCMSKIHRIDRDSKDQKIKARKIMDFTWNLHARTKKSLMVK